MTASVLALSPRRWLFAAGGQPLRVLLALGSAMALCVGTGHMHALIPAALGIIASALAETDDSWQGRWRAQALTLVCFAAMAFTIEALFGRPWLFIAGLALSAFALTMLGAIEARFKAIGHATLILAMYTTLSLDHVAATEPRWHEVALLLAGAGWYGAWSVGWAALFPAEPVQALLVRLFDALGGYVRFKASLFEPLRGVDIERKRLSLAQLNSRVVAELNAAKESIFRRVGSRAPTGRITRYRGLYLIAQDVHERASSSHDDYNALADAFFHSDVLYRCQRVLALQGEACQRLALSIARREPFVAGGATVLAVRPAQRHRARTHPCRYAIDRGRRHVPRAGRGAAACRCGAALSHSLAHAAQLRVGARRASHLARGGAVGIGVVRQHRGCGGGAGCVGAGLRPWHAGRRGRERRQHGARGVGERGPGGGRLARGRVPGANPARA